MKIFEVTSIIILFSPLFSCFFRENMFNKIRKTHIQLNNNKNYYPFSKKYFEDNLKRLNSKNITVQTNAILNDEFVTNLNETFYKQVPYRIIIHPNKNDLFNSLGLNINNDDSFESDTDSFEQFKNSYSYNKKSSSKHFTVIKNFPVKFKNIGEIILKRIIKYWLIN
jgi:hypothetical protein